MSGALMIWVGSGWRTSKSASAKSAAARFAKSSSLSSPTST